MMCSFRAGVMILHTCVAILFFKLVYSKESCYWNAQCPNTMYATKTPYDSVRGDIRDYSNPSNCEAVSVWAVIRHGNRNPEVDTTDKMKKIAALKDDIIESHKAGKGHLCAQDIENLKSWTWNQTLEVSPNFLTGTGYEEIFDIGKRLRERYPHLLKASEDQFYVRSTNTQRTITSSMAFIHGLTEGTDLNLSMGEPGSKDEVIKPYDTCDRYHEEVKSGDTIENNINTYISTEEYQSVRNRVQDRLGIITQISSEDTYTLYELCRFYRSWSPVLQSPWCAVFSNDDLTILEYKDDVRHYYRNGYGSAVNAKLGELVLKDLYENLVAGTNGTGKNIVSYFTHDTMMEMTFCALGMFKDELPIHGAIRDPNRRWRTSFTASFSSNFIAVLNKCQSSNETYRVQIFVNEKETEVCPVEGCTWSQFLEKLSPFKHANRDFCNLDYKEPNTLEGLSNGVHITKLGLLMFVTQIFLTAYLS